MIVYPTFARNRQRGYSLLELLIGMTVSVVATTAAVLLITKFARTAGAYAEVSTLEEMRGSAEAVMRADFDGAGFNLTRPSAPGAGKELIQFASTNSDFNCTSAGSLSKLTDNPTYAYSSRQVSSGVSLWQWTPATICKTCWIYLTGNDGSVDAIGTYYDESGVSSIGIYESLVGNYVASSFGTGTPIPNHAAGDTYQIGVEAPNQQQTSRFVRYYRIRSGVRTILYTSQNVVPAYPEYMLAYLASAGSSVNNVSLIGAPVEYRQNNLTEFAHLPFVGGTQLTSPVTIAGNSVVILSGDKATDTSPALTVFSANSPQIDLKAPQRGTYANGDTVLIIDYGSTDPANLVSPATAVCVVTAVSNPDSVTTRLTVTRARQTSPAAGGLWSSDVDHAHTFTPAETVVVKLAPPVTYAISTDSRLVRVEGYRVATVAFNVRQFTVTQSGSAPAQSFSVSAALAAEGLETANDAAGESRSTIEFTSTPRAMNLASNRMN
jgi:prepilin-type N-terminal cleavage/methylation domain-containing protein